jgi:23S rRNA (cytosine1962-C5)-methyltransferase
MQIISTPGWEDYSLLDSGKGYRLEQFGKFRIARPDPQCIWSPKLGNREWEHINAIFERDQNGKERWNLKTKMPEKWLIRYKGLSFYSKLTPFKHTGLFPEQHLQWDWMEEKIKNKNQKLKILNLFAYTGIASLVAAKHGCEVTHVDASTPSIAWARDNQAASGLTEKPIRWIREDVLKYCEREVRRGKQYDGIIMDPPVYGHGPSGEVWDFNRSFPQLLAVCRQLLSDDPQFIIINAYAISASSLMLENVLADHVQGLDGSIEVGELCLEEKINKRLLSTGIFARWSPNK